MAKQKIIAVDFDDTLETIKKDGTVVLNLALINNLIQAQKEGAILIGYTNWFFENYNLQNALGRKEVIALLAEAGLIFPAIVITKTYLDVFRQIKDAYALSGQTHQAILDSLSDDEKLQLLGDLFKNQVEPLETKHGYKGGKNASAFTEMQAIEQELELHRQGAKEEMQLAQLLPVNDKFKNGKEEMFRLILAIFGRDKEYIVFDDKSEVRNVVEAIAEAENISAHGFFVERMKLVNRGEEEDERFDYAEAIANPEKVKKQLKRDLKLDTTLSNLGLLLKTIVPEKDASGVEHPEDIAMRTFLTNLKIEIENYQNNFDEGNSENLLSAYKALSRLYQTYQTRWDRLMVTKQRLLELRNNVAEIIQLQTGSTPSDDTLPEATSIYIFDDSLTLTYAFPVIRDEVATLEQDFINPHFIIPFLRTIESVPHTHWAIASNHEVKENKVFPEIIREIGNNKLPGYAQWNGINTLLEHMSKVSDVVVYQNDVELPAAPVEDKNLAQRIIQHVLAQPTQDFGLNKPYTLPGDDKYSFELSANSNFHFQFGQTEIVVNAKQFYEKLPELNAGGFKLFNVLQILDQYKKMPLLTDELNQFGISAINSPHPTIDSKDVHFVDDNLSNCEQIRNAGFNAIPADNPHVQHETENAHLHTLESSLSNEMRLTLVREKKRYLIQKINQAVLGKSVITPNNALAESPDEDEDSYLGWMEENASGTRGLTRFSHWYHGDSGKNRARDLLAITNNFNSSYEDITDKLAEVISESSNTNHSLKTYLYKVIGEETLEQILPDNSRRQELG